MSILMRLGDLTMTAMGWASIGAILAFLTAGALLYSTYLSHQDNTREHDELGARIDSVSDDVQAVQAGQVTLRDDVQAVQAGQDTLRLDVQAGFAQLSEQIANLQSDGPSTPANDD